MREPSFHEDLGIFDTVAADLEAKGFTVGDIATNGDLRAYADARFRQLSDPADVTAANQAVAMHERLGFLLPGYFSTTAKDISLLEPKGE